MKKQIEKIQADDTISNAIVEILARMTVLSDIADKNRYIYDKKHVESGIREIDKALNYLKQRYVIESEGMEITQKQEAITDGSPLPIVCIETGKVYDSISQASQDTGINSGNISLAVRGIIPATKGFHWAPWLPDEGRPLTVEKKRTRSIPVLCVETGVIYRSVAEASSALCINKSSISQCINGKAEEAGGLHWERADSEGKPIR